jgi:hypothetical protein
MAVGYVLGAQAGRARYEQIKQAASGLMQRPEVQQALEQARTAAPAQLRPAIDKLAASTSAGPGAGGQGTGGLGTGGLGAGTTAEPASDAGGPGRAGGPLPDPLIPPPKSG